MSRFAYWIVERVGALKRALSGDGRPRTLMRALTRLDARTYASGVLAPRRGATPEVIGSRSGRPVSLPVAVVELDGSRFLVSMLEPLRHGFGASLRLCHFMCAKRRLRALSGSA